MIVLGFLNWIFSTFVLSLLFGGLFDKSNNRVVSYSCALFIFLTIHWFYFLISFYNLGLNINLLSFLSVLLIGIIIIKGKADYLFNLIQDIGVALIILIPLLAQFGDVFNAWDAVASVNYWAIDIYNNEYLFTGTAYPVLISSIIALVYEFQSTYEINLTAKIALLVIPIYFVMIIGANKKFNNLYISIIIIFYFYLINNGTISGEVNFPLVVGGLSVLYLCFISFKTNNIFYLYFAILIAGPVSLIKQAGIPFIIFTIIITLYIGLTAKFNKSSSLKLLAVFILSALFPLSFYYIHYISTDSLTSNFEYLVNLSSQSSIYEIFIRTFREPGPSLDFILLPLSLVVFIKSFFDRSRNDHGFHLVLFVFFIFGYSFWAYAFSYDTRNLFWAKSFALFSLCIYSSENRYIFKISEVIHNLNIKKIYLGLPMTLFCFIYFGYMIFRGDNLLHNYQERGQSLIGPKNVAIKINQLLSPKSDDNCPYLVTNHLMLPHNYHLRDFKNKIIDTPSDVNGILSHEVPKCSGGGYIYFGPWSKNDPNWHIISKKIKELELIVSDSKNNIYYRP